MRCRDRRVVSDGGSRQISFDSFVLAASTPDLSEAVAASEHADAVEYRIDLSSEGLDGLSGYEGPPLIVTNRLDAEGGSAPPGATRRERLVRAASHPAVVAIDIELATVRAGDATGVLEAAREHDTRVIVSVHSFETTLSRPRLESLLEAAAAHGDVAKLATYAEDPSDVLDLLAATQATTAAGHRVATMAMGEIGRHSRAVAPLYGSRIGYAPLAAADATAPGQYDLATLRALIEDLGGPSPNPQS